MSKAAGKATGIVSFIRFWQYCERHLGSAKLQLDTQANNLQNLCGDGTFALDPIKPIIRKSFKASHCQRLQDPICLNSTLDILGEIAFTLRDSERDDLLDIELLEEIGWCICQLYQDDVKFKEPQPSSTSQASSAQVFKLNQFKSKCAQSRSSKA